MITGADGAAWVTDGGRNSIIRVDATSEVVTEYPLPDEAADANLNTAVFDADGVLWFTGQNGWYGKVGTDGTVAVYPAPEGRGPYGIAATSGGDVYFASLAGSYVGRIDPATGAATVLEPPVPDQGSRRVWADSAGPGVGERMGVRRRVRLRPGDRRVALVAAARREPDAVRRVRRRDRCGVAQRLRRQRARPLRPDDRDVHVVPAAQPDGAVRQLHGRPGEVWGAESSADQLVVVRRTP